jgi:hypothetical protein
VTDYGDATEAAIARVVKACERYGAASIIGLAGVPGTGKSYIAAIAAQRYTAEPLLVRSVQFHRSYTYEEFIEGMRLDQGGAVEVVSGVFLDWNQRALVDPGNRYVLLIDELTRADMSAVLGELMTYLEHRERPFFTMYGRRDVFVAPNLVVLATYNPTDRSALDLDNALIRRMRILPFPPDMGQLREMLSGADLSSACIERLCGVFQACREAFPDTYESLMPFGHGMFSQVASERPDLYLLWEERLRFLLQRPSLDPHPFKQVIEQAYPWRDPEHVEE